MRTQNEMFNFLNEKMGGYTIETNKNKIFCKKLQPRNYSNFILTYLKNGQVSLHIGSLAQRFSNEEDMFEFMGVFSLLK